MYEIKPFDIIKVSSNDGSSQEGEISLVYDPADQDVQIFNISFQKSLDEIRAIKIENKDLSEGYIPDSLFVLTNKISMIRKSQIIQKIAHISTSKIDEILRRLAYTIVEKHYIAVHSNSDNFLPGKTYVRYAGRKYNADEMNAVVDSALDFWLTAGRFAKQFEEGLAKFIGVKHCLLTNSGSSANLLAISALTSPKLGEKQLRPGDEIITVACAFPTTINPILQNNLVPVFLDVGIGNYNIQANNIEAAISEKTKAIFLAHTLGNPFEINKVLDLCKKYNLWLIEDNCDALGTKYGSKHTGCFGDIATFSFYPAHHITTGEGGALTTNDIRLKRIIESFRDWGRDCWCDTGCDNTCGKRFGWQLGGLPFGYDHKFIYSHIGYNLKITDMQAAVGVAQLKKLPDFIQSRKNNWKSLYKGLKNYETYFELPKPTEHSDPCWFGFPLTVKESAPFTRNDITNYLEKNRIATRLLFSGNILQHPCFEKAKYRMFDNLRNTDFIMNNTFWVGIYPGINDLMMGYMLNTFDNFLKS